MFNNYSGNMLSLTRVNSGHNNQPTEALTQSPTSSLHWQTMFMVQKIFGNMVTRTLRLKSLEMAQ